MGTATEKPPPPAHEAAPAGRGIPPSLLWSMFMILVIYPLGIGPAAWLHKTSPAARPAIEAVYKPITLLMDHAPTFRFIIQWYVGTVWHSL